MKDINTLIKSDVINNLQLMLKDMDVPFYRLVFNKNNLVWLQKNLKKKNQTHKNYEITKQLIDDCLNQRLYKS